MNVLLFGTDHLIVQLIRQKKSASLAILKVSFVQNKAVLVQELFLAFEA